MTRGFVALFFAVALAACGGGGSGSSGGGNPGSGGSGGGGSSSSVTGNVPAPAAGPGDASQYFPMAQADSWTYDETAGEAAGSFTGSSLVTVSGTATISGQQTVVFNQTSTTNGVTGGPSYYAESGGGLTQYATTNSAGPLAPLSPFAQLLFPVQAGPVSAIQAKDISFGTASNGDPLTATLNQTVAVADFETVTVAAGVFTGCAKVVTTITGNVTDTKSGQSVPFSGTDTAWLAPGVGVVNKKDSSNVQGATTTDSLGLRGYTINGVAHGLGTPTNVEAGFGSSMDNYEVAAATSGSTSLVVAEDNPSSTPVLKAYLLDAHGSVIATQVLGAGYSPSVFFDGTNYEVVYWGYFAPAATIVQLISPTGTLGASYNALTNQGQGISSGAVQGVGEALLAYYYAGTIYGAFLLPNGTVQAPGRVTLSGLSAVSASLTGFAVAFDGTNYLLVWSETDPVNTPNEVIYARRVSSTGAAVDPTPFVVTNTSTVSDSLSVAFDGTNYLVTWLDNRTATGPTDPNRVVLAARLSTAGGILSSLDVSGGIDGFPISATSVLTPRSSPKVAFNGAEYLVVWVTHAASSFTATTFGGGIAAARVLPNGGITSGTGFEIPIASNGSSGVQLGEGFAVPALTGGAQGVIAWIESGANGANSTVTSVYANAVWQF